MHCMHYNHRQKRYCHSVHVVVEMKHHAPLYKLDPMTGKRLDTMKNNFSLPGHLSLKNVINSGLPTVYNSLDAQQQ